MEYELSAIDRHFADFIRREAVKAWMGAHPEALDDYLDPSMEEQKRDWVRRDQLPDFACGLREASPSAPIDSTGRSSVITAGISTGISESTAAACLEAVQAARQMGVELEEDDIVLTMRVTGVPLAVIGPPVNPAPLATLVTVPKESKTQNQGPVIRRRSARQPTTTDQRLLSSRGATEWVHTGRPVLYAVHVERSGVEVYRIPPERHKFPDPQSVTVREQDQCFIPSAVPARSPRRVSGSSGGGSSAGYRGGCVPCAIAGRAG